MKWSVVVLLFLFSTEGASAKSMRASWYGLHDHTGLYTADGTRFSAYNPHIVAHRRLPFGTQLRIINPRNNRILYAEVHDRGPFVRGRQLDLTYAGAQRLGVSGVAVLEVEVVH